MIFKSQSVATLSKSKKLNQNTKKTSPDEIKNKKQEKGDNIVVRLLKKYVPNYQPKPRQHLKTEEDL